MMIFQPGGRRQRRGGILRIIAEPGVHGGHREILRQPDADPLQDGGGRRAGRVRVGVRMLQLSFRTERGKHVLQ